MRRATEGVALELSAQVSLLIALLRPPLLATHGPQLARRVDSARLTCRQVEGQGGSAQARGRGLALSGHHNRSDAGSLRTHARAGWRYQASGQSLRVGEGCWLTAAHEVAAERLWASTETMSKKHVEGGVSSDPNFSQHKVKLRVRLLLVVVLGSALALVC